jgi:hypothetical protein
MTEQELKEIEARRKSAMPGEFTFEDDDITRLLAEVRRLNKAFESQITFAHAAVARLLAREILGERRNETENNLFDLVGEDLEGEKK